MLVVTGKEVWQSVTRWRCCRGVAEIREEIDDVGASGTDVRHVKRLTLIERRTTIYFDVRRITSQARDTSNSDLLTFHHRWKIALKNKKAQLTQREARDSLGI